MTTDDNPQANRPTAADESFVEGLEELRRISTEIAAHADRSIDLLSQELDATLYDQRPFLDSIKRLSLASHQSSVRILLCDNARVQREGHRLVELARQLPRNIQIRRPAELHRQLHEELLIADSNSYLRRDLRIRNRGIAGFHDRLRTEQLARRFAEIWEQSSVESELRRLYL